MYVVCRLSAFDLNLKFSIYVFMYGGFSQNVLAENKWIHRWIHIVRSIARNRRGSACTHASKCACAHQKNKSEIGLHHGIFLCRHLLEKLNTTL